MSTLPFKHLWSTRASFHQLVHLEYTTSPSAPGRHVITDVGRTGAPILCSFVQMRRQVEEAGMGMCPLLPLCFAVTRGMARPWFMTCLSAKACSV